MLSKWWNSIDIIILKLTTKVGGSRCRYMSCNNSGSALHRHIIQQNTLANGLICHFLRKSAEVSSQNVDIAAESRSCAGLISNFNCRYTFFRFTIPNITGDIVKRKVHTHWIRLRGKLVGKVKSNRFFTIVWNQSIINWSSQCGGHKEAKCKNELHFCWKCWTFGSRWKDSEKLNKCSSGLIKKGCNGLCTPLKLKCLV